MSKDNTLEKLQWTLLAAGAGALAGYAARKATAMAWEHFSDEDLPSEQPNPSTKNLLIWAGASAVAMALASTSARIGIKHYAKKDDPHKLTSGKKRT